MGRKIADLNEIPIIDVDDVAGEDFGNKNMKELDLLSQVGKNTIDNASSDIKFGSFVSLLPSYDANGHNSSKVNCILEAPLPRMVGYVDLLKCVNQAASAQAAGHPLAMGPFPTHADVKHVGMWRPMALPALYITDSTKAMAVKGRKVQPITPVWFPSAYKPESFCSACMAKKSPLWRNGPNGIKSLCNACGIRYQKQVKRSTMDTTEATKQLKRTALEIIEVLDVNSPAASEENQNNKGKKAKGQ